MNETIKDYSYFKRREAINRIRATLARDDELFDNPRSDYWRHLNEVKEALRDLEENQALEANQTAEISLLNDKARRKYEER